MWTDLPGAEVGGASLPLWRVGQWLWAQRLGHRHMYWAMGEELLSDGGPRLDGEVPKDKEGGVFHLGPFMADLIIFIKGSRQLPCYALWFYVKQLWPQDQPRIK